MDFRVSVVIPAYNAEKHIGRAIDSILRQEFPVYEIVVVDDGSTDNTGMVVKQYTTGNILYIVQENGGPSKARNNGIMHSTGDYIAFLDADDEWYPNHIFDAYSFFINNQNIYWFSSAYNEENLLFDIKTIAIKTKTNPIGYCQNTLRRSIIHTSAVVIHRSVFDSVGHFNESWRFGEDLNLWIRIALKYPSIGYCPKPGSVFKKTQGSLTFDKSNYDLKNTLRVLYFTNKEVVASNNHYAIKLVDQWIEDAAFNALIRDNKGLILYIRKRWHGRVSWIVRFLLYVGFYCPHIVLKVIRNINKLWRKIC